MNPHEEAKIKAARAYNAAADLFDHPANSFWDRFGVATVERLGLRPGQQVLDVCSGTGASALPAAQRVGPNGKVVAADLAQRLLAAAAAKARAQGLNNIEFREDDLMQLGYPDASFDAAVCVFGIFFVPDMAAAVRELWRQLRPGGQLAITTWGPNLFEPANGYFWEAIRSERPELYKGFNPWDRISTPASLRAMLSESGVPQADIVDETAVHPLSSPDDWWTLAMGSGYRSTLDQLDSEQLLRVKHANLSRLSAQNIRQIEANVVYAVAKKT